jgi:hypothetical protein
MTSDEIETANALFYAETLTAFTRASVAAWREYEDAEKTRRDALAAHWLDDVWTREEMSNGE